MSQTCVTRPAVLPGIENPLGGFGGILDTRYGSASVTRVDDGPYPAGPHD